MRDAQASAGSSTSRSINGQKGQFGQANYASAKAGDDRLHQGAGAGRCAQAASRSTRSARATSAPRWSRAVPEEVLKTRSCRRSRSAASASPRRSPAASCSWPARTPASSPAPPSRQRRPVHGLTGAACDEGGKRPRRPSAGAVDPVAGVAEAWQDVAVIVEPGVDGRRVDSDVGMGRGHAADAFGRGQEAGKLDLGRPRRA